MSDDAFKDLFGVKRDDPLVILNTLTTDVSTLKVHLEATRSDIADMKTLLPKYGEIMQALIRMQEQHNSLSTLVAENKTRIESIDVLKKEIEQNRENIIPDGKTKIATLEKELQGLKIEITEDINKLDCKLTEFRNERWKMLTGLGALGLTVAGFVFHDVIWPFLQGHFH